MTRFADRLLRRGNTKTHAALLERAGVATRMADLAALTGVGSLVAAAAGLVLVGPLAALLLATAVPLAVRVALGVLAGRRRKAFADQLGDSLQLIASSLRAGHSLLEALASVAREAAEPSSVEFARIINETRVGRPLTLALVTASTRGYALIVTGAVLLVVGGLWLRKVVSFKF